MFYTTNINSMNSFFTFMNDKLLLNNYLIRRYINEENNYELLATSKNGKFSVGFKSLIDTVNNIYTIELQMFKDYIEDNHIHNQFLSIPKKGYKNFNNYNNYYSPQICINDDEEAECKFYLKVEEDYIIAIHDVMADESFRSGFYIGKFKNYSLDYQNPWVCIGSTLGLYQDFIMTQYSKSFVDETLVSKYDSVHQTNMVGWIGCSAIENQLVLNYVLEPNNVWSGLINNQTYPNFIFNRDHTGTDASYQTVASAHIFPLLKVDKSLGGYKNDDIQKWPIILVSSINSISENFNSNTGLGELYDIIRVKGRNLINDSEYIFDGYKWQCIKIGHVPSSIAENFSYMIRKEKV